MRGTVAAVVFRATAWVDLLSVSWVGFARVPDQKFADMRGGGCCPILDPIQLICAEQHRLRCCDEDCELAQVRSIRNAAGCECLDKRRPSTAERVKNDVTEVREVMDSFANEALTKSCGVAVEGVGEGPNPRA
jgi:hypothetical protein